MTTLLIRVFLENNVTRIKGEEGLHEVSMYLLGSKAKLRMDISFI